MSAQLSITRSGEPLDVAAGTTAGELFTDDRDVVVARVNGELRDLSHVLADGDVVEGVPVSSEEGLAVLRHSTAHVMAQAVQQHFPEAKLGIGPPIRDGFYFDFDVERPFTPEDLKTLEKTMQRIVKEGQRFVRREVTDDEARAAMAGEPYKLELIGLKSSAGEAAEGASAEVGEGGLSIYDNLRRDDSVAFSDLCRGPHIPTTRLVGNGFSLLRSAAAYWRGSEKNPQLQRIYGTAWPSKEELKAYQERVAEAERRDHRKLGAELDLFSFPDEIGSGLVVFHPKGGVVKREMEDYVRRRHIEEGFSYVGTPHISKGGLFETSGHLPYYEDTMFPGMELENSTYYLKAMNCPMHNLIFRSRGRSYRELPLRFFEFGSVYRYEKSGVVHGLTRVRGLTQDDSHSYVTPEQAPGEIKHLLDFVLGLLRDFGLDDYYLELSTRGDSEKFIGSDEEWERATAVLETAAKETGLELVADPGGAAFYGPKISVQAKDAIGRTWQMSTIQYDFNQPARFELEYTATDGTKQQPVMIHSAKFGSLERFFGVLVEHYAGAFPPWLAPVQVVGIPVADAHVPHLREVAERLQAAGIRVEVDDTDDRMPKKIRTWTKQKIPFLLIAGAEDVENGAVSFRFRDGSQENGVPVADAVERIAAAVRDRVQV
ncbi:threonine--tRNA ligase [Kineococcus rhizosphaerae]|uniref:Threonine--tRNA ligase n=1 Tax=Kineococcus rhizosphaerae TaxID=559628 RepID=A0A2T0R9P8_9ACTN|nr:threonine--tRNA ligase [Kineococcus rhizosphaerae]PRY17860.1 Ser-tRNA(Thr) hydrolase /threonyl-tRNA synthetase [Kineococcus rhizosphaerae]